MIGAVLFSVFKQFESNRTANPTISYTRLMEQASAKQIDKVEIVEIWINQPDFEKKQTTMV